MRICIANRLIYGMTTNHKVFILHAMQMSEMGARIECICDDAHGYIN